MAFTRKKVIDVSKHNGTVNYEAIKNAGIYGVIIRVGYKRPGNPAVKDPMFEINYMHAKEAGLMVGAYWYSYAANAINAKEDATACLDFIKGKRFELPIYYDVEENSMISSKSKIQELNKMIPAFCSSVENEKYFVGIYSTNSWFTSYISSENAKRYTCWVARWSTYKPTVEFDLWQYTAKATFPDNFQPYTSELLSPTRASVREFIPFDCSYLYRDFPTIIKNNKLNGFANSLKYSIIASTVVDNKNDVKRIVETCKSLGMDTKTDVITK